MSYWIEYQAVGFVLPASEIGLPQSRYVVAVEGGSNNTTVLGRNGRERRARSWSIAMIGTADQVLRQAVRAAAACEGGSLQPKGRRTTPEAYIGRARRLLRDARADAIRHLTFSAQVPQGHALVALAQAAGYVLYPESLHGEALVKLIPTQQDAWAWGTYFGLLHPYLDSCAIEPWRLGQVFGLPAS
jgi:hypothetical protein